MRYALRVSSQHADPKPLDASDLNFIYFATCCAEHLLLSLGMTAEDWPSDERVWFVHGNLQMH